MGKRGSGKMHLSNPIISELETSESQFDQEQKSEYLVRNESLGARSGGSLHRDTPVPINLSSTSSGSGRYQGLRLSTPTIEEHGPERYFSFRNHDCRLQCKCFLRRICSGSHLSIQNTCISMFCRDSMLDSSEHYYGGLQRLEDLEVAQMPATISRGDAQLSARPAARFRPNEGLQAMIDGESADGSSQGPPQREVCSCA